VIGANQMLIQHSSFFWNKWVTIVSSPWYMQMFWIDILQALRKAGTIITGNPGKNILPKKQKNKMPLSEPAKLVRLYYNLFNSKNQQLWKSSC